MESIELRASETRLLCYDEDDEVVKSYEFMDTFGIVPDNYDKLPIRGKLTDEESLDLTQYPKVVLVAGNDDRTYYHFEKELPDDFEFETYLTHVIMPNKEVIDIYEIKTKNFDYDEFSTESGCSFIDRTKYTPEGAFDVEDDEIDENEWDY